MFDRASKWFVQDERDLLFRDTTVGAQRRVQATQIVFLASRAECEMPLGKDHEIAQPVRGQTEALSRIVAMKDGLHPIEPRQYFHGRADLLCRCAIDCCERAQRAVVYDIRICNRQDDL